MRSLQLSWYGPYRWYGSENEVLFKKVEANQSGIYLWSISFQGDYLVYYVGETGRSFITRFTEHTHDYLSGLYEIYDPRQFAVGKKVFLWEGVEAWYREQNRGVLTSISRIISTHL